jgi:hypothetical protein
MRSLLSTLIALPLFAAPAFGWGCEGHQMIALIARAHLTPQASAAVDRLLTDSPMDAALKRFCRDRPADLMADSATWADDVKPIEKTGEWHYTNIPLSVHDGNVMKWCDPIGPSVDGKDRPGCIINAIELEWKTLRDPAQSPAARATALRYVIHLLGDLSQPLHVSDNHDEGGNCTRMRFFFQEKPENLHGIWDYKILEQDITREVATQSQYARMLDHMFAGHWHDWGESKTDVIAWSWEGQKISAKVTYGNLMPRIPVARADAGATSRAECDAGRNSTEALHITIDDAYAAEALPVIREQVAKAGYRLAGLLNQTFK